MAYEVLARKWRPQQFSDVVGQGHVTRTLTNAIETDRVAHAYMFVGSRGTGKTTSARILAKALNCEKGPTPYPCDVCDSCKEVMAGNSLDVIEIDGASNNGVDQVRDLRDNARYAPARGPYKIYIIDEVHMLSTQAFNALLKTLEEPPEHVKFIFATTDVHKVLPTILSRCQRFDLRRISVQDIVDRLRKGCEEEGINITEDALLAIARGAEGGLRDAESALDQIISFRGKDIGEDDVLAVFGLVSRHVLENLTMAILKSDVPQIIHIVAEMDQAGKDLQRVVMELLESFRNLLVVIYAESGAAALELPEAQLAYYKNIAPDFEAGRILKIIDLLVEADGRMRYALSKKTLLETGLIRCSRAAETATINELLKQVADLKKNFKSGGAVAGSPSATTVSFGTSGQKKKIAPAGEVETLLKTWYEIIDQVGKADLLAKSSLLNTAPLKTTETQLVVGYDPEFTNDRSRLEDNRAKLALSRAVERYLGRQLSVVYEPLKADDPRPLPADKPMNSSGAGKTQMLTKEQQWYANPVVRLVVDAFNGEITDIRE
ncbi:DNA polymerase III subunit gamma/tau [Pontiella agarivorans]|uniref:DNA polymerase III subunit gamma/tau n=1 Tax=Pontiella agarivorans TaxID=3038953 RepID=A0ABU5N1T7_9BACT|nr:DNA polymerase III subunit gamma/tau [Pontiella agarivorans]MDZ8120419.1 DNA polymerase III subunit gamma/tau [Pontiella agarivorans]